MLLVQFTRDKAKPAHRTRGQVMEQHVSPGQETPQDVGGLGPLEIQRE